MKSSVLMEPFYIVAALAQNNNGLPVAGPSKPGIGSTPAAEQVSEEAGRHPNATSSVAFSRMFNNTSEAWEWRTNITEFAVPNRLADLGLPSANFSEHLHVVNIQWQLDWPGVSGQSLQSFLSRRNMSVYINTLITNLPSHVTSRYSDADNGDCAAILGTACTQSLSQAAADESPIDFVDLDGCQGTLNAVASGIDVGIGFEIAALNDSTTPALQNTNTLFFLTTNTYTTGNVTIFHEAESALQLLILDFRGDTPAHGSDGGPTMLCRVVDKALESSVTGWPSSTSATWSLVVMTAMLFWL